MKKLAVFVILSGIIVAPVAVKTALLWGFLYAIGVSLSWWQALAVVLAVEFPALFVPNEGKVAPVFVTIIMVTVAVWVLIPLFGVAVPSPWLLAAMLIPFFVVMAGLEEMAAPTIKIHAERLRDRLQAWADIQA
jgi:hypothetical protein